MVQQTLGPDEGDHLCHAFPAFQIGKNERPFAAHAPCIARHELETGAQVSGQICFIDQLLGKPSPFEWGQESGR